MALTAPAAATAARLAGGRQQARLAAAFFARPAHRGQAIVSTRVSTVAPAWAVVTSVRPQRAGRGAPAGRTPPLQRTYYHLVKGREKLAVPPRSARAARADLAAPFRVAVTYRASGAESIAYHQLYRSVCAGAGGFSDTEQVTVQPMSWRVRYVVDLDDLQSAVRGPAGTVLVPAVSFDRAGSTVSAREILTRTAIDRGCNGQPTTYDCNASYSLGPRLTGAALLPRRRGASRWASPRRPTRAATAIRRTSPSGRRCGTAARPPRWPASPPRRRDAARQPLRAGGRRLAANAPALSTGMPASPCQGDAAACRDTFRWSGHVSLQNLP